MPEKNVRPAGRWTSEQVETSRGLRRLLVLLHIAKPRYETVQHFEIGRLAPGESVRIPWPRPGDSHA